MARATPANDSLDLLHADLAAAYMAPTWVHVSEFVAVEPRVGYRPWLWRWDTVIPLLERAGDLITPERGAERRSMEHVNPDLRPQYATSHSIATALQLVRAGERAPAHRHAAAAVRFAARSRGGQVYTRVDGETLPMQENDLILTPAWSWHEHANETPHDIVWLDALDFPLVNLMQASLFEPGASQAERATGTSRSELRYPWSEMHARLEEFRSTEGDPYDDLLLPYVSADGGPTLPTMSCRAHLLRSGFHGRARRSTASTVYFVIAGGGAMVIEGVRFDWRRGDVFVVPNWRWHEHAAGAEDSWLFSVTDHPVMQRLGLYREQAMHDDGHQVVIGRFAS
jgi:gentisate 1,2-dioxygenase